MTSPALQSEAETVVHLLDDLFDAIEIGIREWVRDFLQAMIESEVAPSVPGRYLRLVEDEREIGHHSARPR